MPLRWLISNPSVRLPSLWYVYTIPVLLLLTLSPKKDLHPGNLLIRNHPDHPSKPQLILIDHGLYIDLDEKFRLQYCLLWRSLFTGDIKTIEGIVQSWGIGKENSELFASMTLLRPHRLGNKEKVKKEKMSKMTQYEKQAGLKDRVREMLKAQEDIPKELIFLTRTMR